MLLSFLKKKSSSEPLLSPEEKESQVDQSREVDIRLKEFLPKKAALVALQSLLDQLKGLHALNEESQSAQISDCYNKIKANQAFKDLQQKERQTGNGTMAKLESAHTQLVDPNSKFVQLQTVYGAIAGRDQYLADFTAAHTQLNKSLEKMLIDVNSPFNTKQPNIT
jgi:hypothetical protein